MLSEEHLTQLANAMVLSDLLDKNREDGHETDEIRKLHEELQQWVDSVTKTLDQTEMNQVIERYALERNDENLKSLR